jgi:hypothetical protein
MGIIHGIVRTAANGGTPLQTSATLVLANLAEYALPSRCVGLGQRAGLGRWALV